MATVLTAPTSTALSSISSSSDITVGLNGCVIFTPQKPSLLRLRSIGPSTSSLSPRALKSNSSYFSSCPNARASCSCSHGEREARMSRPISPDLSMSSETRPQPDVVGPADHIVQGHVDPRLGARNERRFLVEQVVHAAAQLEAFAELPGREQIPQRIGRHARLHVV